LLIPYFTVYKPHFFLPPKAGCGLLCLHDLPSLSPKVCFPARSGPPFVIRDIPIQWERSGLQMADLNEQITEFWGERREIVQTQKSRERFYSCPMGLGSNLALWKPGCVLYTDIYGNCEINFIYQTFPIIIILRLCWPVVRVSLWLIIFVKFVPCGEWVIKACVLFADRWNARNQATS